MAPSQEAQAFCEKIDERLVQGSGNQIWQAAQMRRTLFGEFAALWNAAELKGDSETTGALVQIRSKLHISYAKQTLLFKLSMYLRLALTVVVAFYGCVCVLALTPLRLTHPMLRSLGIRNGRLPVDIVCYCWGRSILAAAGVKVLVDSDLQQIWNGIDTGIIVYNHGSNLDPLIINRVCGGFAPKYIGKQVLFKIPIVGWFFLLTGNVGINRGNREKAIATMNQAVMRIMTKWGRCVAIAPEGTRSPDGHLTLPFKKGPFHLQDQAKVPMMPLLIYGAHALWPPKQLFSSSGKVRVTAVPVIRPQGTDASRLQLQKVLADGASKHPERGSEPLTASDWIENVLILCCTAIVYWFFWRLFAATISVAGLSRHKMMVMLVMITGSVQYYVDNRM